MTKSTDAGLEVVGGLGQDEEVRLVLGEFQSLVNGAFQVRGAALDSAVELLRDQISLRGSVISEPAP